MQLYSPLPSGLLLQGEHIEPFPVSFRSYGLISVFLNTFHLYLPLHLLAGCLICSFPAMVYEGFVPLQVYFLFLPPTDGSIALILVTFVTLNITFKSPFVRSPAEGVS